MNTLNQVVVEGTLDKIKDGWDEETLIVSYLIGDYGYATKLDMSRSLEEKIIPFVGKNVRIVGKLAGDEIVVEHVDTLDLRR